jgi:putative membrane protein
METKPPRTLKQYLYLFFSGGAMGAADVVPGVSGGTMAFILGVYEELINTIKSFNLALIPLVLKFRIKDALEHVNWKFLVCLGGGIFTAILSLAHGITWLLEHHPVPLFAFFFGLVLASIVAISVHVHWKPSMVVTLIVGTAVAYFVVGLVPMNMPNTPLILFCSGAVAICAMILPGISGSFILLILGQYEHILNGLKALNFSIIIPAVAGMAVGIMAFARVLSWLLKYYHQVTITLLVGFMLGSLRKIWPFKEVEEWMQDPHGVPVPMIEKNILPDFGSGVFWLSLGLCVFGFVIISLLDHIQSRNNPFFKLFRCQQTTER